jgi:hypothetical protein
LSAAERFLLHVINGEVDQIYSKNTHRFDLDQARLPLACSSTPESCEMADAMPT